MSENNNYNGSIIYSELLKDIQKHKFMIFVSGLFFFLLIMIAIPIALWLFFGLLFYADLPFFDHSLIDMFSSTKIFLFPYTLLLIFYFIVMYVKDKKLHLTNQIHFQKAIKYFTVSLFIVVLPYIFENHILLTILYFIFFILTIHHLSLTYYDVELQKQHNIHNHLYRSEDLGWISSQGMLDNPFSITDDMNRAKLFVQASTLGFDFIILFMNMIVKSAIFTYSINNKQYIQESARLFDLILEENLDGNYASFSVQSKIILESLSYVSFRDGAITLYPRGEEIERLSNIKEEK